MNPPGATSAVPDRAASAPEGQRDAPATTRFYRALASFASFDDIGNPAVFTPLPDDWQIGVADIVASTEAIAAGHYKSVNTAGASVISAVSNTLGTLDFPFIFGGDGASFAVAPEDAAPATAALAATVAWVKDELGLELRGAIVAMRDIRAERLDVQVAKFAASQDVSYAMFAGGGLAWAEERLKSGLIGLAPAPPGSRPDLTGLSCRFRDLKSKHGLILSVLIRPIVRPDDPRFRLLVGDVLTLADQGPDGARPIPVFKTLGGVRFRSIGLNARLGRKPGQSRLGSLLDASYMTAVAAVMLGTGAQAGAFSAKTYLREVVANSDFRKYDDGLMMTLDCTREFADRLEERLAAAERDGIARYGLHRQGVATITCVVPSFTQANHVHFIDGAAGGYAAAATNLKSRLASA